MCTVIIVKIQLLIKKNDAFEYGILTEKFVQKKNGGFREADFR